MQVCLENKNIFDSNVNVCVVKNIAHFMYTISMVTHDMFFFNRGIARVDFKMGRVKSRKILKDNLLEAAEGLRMGSKSIFQQETSPKNTAKSRIPVKIGNLIVNKYCSYNLKEFVLWGWGVSTYSKNGEDFIFYFYLITVLLDPYVLLFFGLRIL